MITPRAKKLIAIAGNVAEEFGHAYVGTEHLFLAMFRLQEGCGAAMLVASGASEEKARAEMLRLHRPTADHLAEIDSLKQRIAELEASK